MKAVEDVALARYRRDRQEFFARYGARWPDILADEFDLLAPLPLSPSEADEILNATANLARIYSRAAGLVRQFSDEALLQMGVPNHLLRVVRCSIPAMADCVVGRFDLARTDEGYKLLEFNADFAGLVVEAFSVNAEVCRDAGRENPNDASEGILISALSEAAHAGIAYTGNMDREEANVVVTSSGCYPRDVAMAKYLCELMESHAAEYVPVDCLSIDEDGLYDPKGKRIDVLYRLLHLHHIRNGIFESGEVPVDSEMGGTMLRLVENRRLAIINPPSSFLLESKALQAVIWNLADSGTYFTEDERRLIQRYMLPTYLDPPTDESTYVVKPIYGGEGDTVSIRTSHDNVVSQATCSSYYDQPMVYQKYVTVPTLELMTEFGRRSLHVVTSCFLISGTPTGICMRAGKNITDENAWVLPSYIESNA